MANLIAAPGCTVEGVGFIDLTYTGTATPSSFTFKLFVEGVFYREIGPTTSSGTANYVANNTYDAYVYDDLGAELGYATGVVVDCAPPLVIDSVTVTNATAYGAEDGSATVTASGGREPLSYSKNGTTWQASNVLTGLAAGNHIAYVRDSGESTPTVQQGYTITEPAPVYGCTDPEATNYNPSADIEDGTCVYPPDVLVDAIPEISPAGNPLTVVLHSRELTATPTKAKVVLQLLTAIAADTTITINDVTFTAKNEPGFQNFFASTAGVGKTKTQVMASLAQAISEASPLNYLYSIKQSGDTVTLEALAVGTVYDITSTSTAAGTVLSITTTAATNQYHSQSLPDWSCYVEVWAGCGVDFGGTTNKDAAVLLGRLEQRYQPGNDYVFDISELLQVEMGHSLVLGSGHQPDRMLSYFLKFGEIYGDSYRNRYYEGETAVRWAIEAALPLSETTYNWEQHLTLSPTPFRLLSNKQVPSQVFVGAEGLIAWQAESLYFLFRKGANAARALYSLTWLYHDGTTTTTTQAPVAIATGGVNRLELAAQDLDARETVRRVLTCTVKLVIEQEDTPGVWSILSESEPRVLTFYRAISPDEQVKQLCFVNSLGGYDPLHMEGSAEPAIKRSPAQFNRSGSRRLTRLVELDHTTRLSSGLLDKATYDWLQAELAHAPDVYYNDQPVNIADIDFKADLVNEEYFVSVDIIPTVGNNSLKN